MEPIPQQQLSPFSGGDRTPFDYDAFRQSQRGMSSADLMADPQRMQSIRDYMVARKGSQFRDVPDDELFESFINHQRFFNVNEVTTVGELMWVNRASEEERAIAAQAYEAFDALGNGFTRDGLSGAAETVWDYGRAMALSPSTWAGAFVGRLASAPVRAKAVQQIGNIVNSTVAKAGPTAAGANVALEAGEQAARQVSAAAARQAATREIATAVAVDTVGSVFQDVAYQRTLMNSGYQDKYNALQSILVGATGVLAGGVASVPYLARQTEATDISIRAAFTTRRKADETFEKAKPEIEKALENFNSDYFDWVKAVGRGERAADNDYDLILKAPRMLLDPNPDNRASIVGAMMRAGVTIPRGETTRQIAAFAKNISPERKQILDDLFKKHVAPDMTFDTMIDIAVASVSKSGETLKLAKDAADALSKVMTARRAADDTIAGLAEPARRAKESVTEAPSPKVVEWLQSSWRRALVSHLATTAVNVIGWGQVEAAKGLAEMVQAGALMSSALAVKMLSRTGSKAGEWANKALLDSRALFSSQVYKLRTMMDPYSTKEAFDTMMKEIDPRQRRVIDRTLFSGVEATSERYGLNPKAKPVKAMEQYLDAAGRVSLMNLQDGLTKSQSFMVELDKQTRLAGLGPINRMLSTGDLSQISDDIFERAIKQTMKSTMSMDYTKGYGRLSDLAKLTETLSNTPGIGFLFPFGRFLNNQLAFLMEYSVFGVLPHLKNFRRANIFNDPDFWESSAKALVGSYAMYEVAKHVKEKQERGLAWHQMEDSTGSVITIQNMAPVSAYFAVGSLYNAWKEGRINDRLVVDTMEQLGPFSIVTQVQSNPLSEIVQGVNNSGGDMTVLNAMFGSVDMLGQMAAGVVSGFLRPIEPIDAAFGMATGSGAMPDRRQLQGTERIIRETTKYVDNLFAPFLGEKRQREDGRSVFTTTPTRQDATQTTEVRDPNALSRMLGRREAMPLTDIDRALAMVNMPAWSIQERSGVPEWDALMNEHITPRLNREARALLESGTWKRASLNGREEMVRQLLSSNREHAIERVLTLLGTHGAVLRERSLFVRRPQTLRAEAMRDLGIDADPTDMSYSQLLQLNAYIDLLSDRFKSAAGR